MHAGGLVWCGPYLHVAGTRRGLFSCLVDDIIRVHSTDDAFGYRFVLPVRFAYDAAASEGVELMRYSFLSLDRGAQPPQLVAGEYGRAEMTRRLVRYPLDPETLHLAAHEDGTSRPVALDDRGLGHMQGAAIVGDTYYVTSSRGRCRLGSPVRRQARAASAAFHAPCPSARRTSPTGPPPTCSGRSRSIRAAATCSR